MKTRILSLALSAVCLLCLLLLVSCGKKTVDATTIPTSPAASDATTSPSSAPSVFTIRFSVDGTVSEVSVGAGELPVFDGTPAKPSDGEYSYVFAGWDREIVPAEGDATYTAFFIAHPVEILKVRWVLADQVVTTSVPKGNMPEEPLFQRTLTAPAWTKTFQGWDKPLSPVVENNTVYTAQYETIPTTFKATFRYGDTVLEETTVEYGKKPVYSGKTPEKAGLTFLGFTNVEVGATSDVVCQAQFCKLDPEQVADALAFDLVAFGPTTDGESVGQNTNRASGFLFLALDAYLSGETNAVSERCLAQLRSVMIGGHEPAFTAGPFWVYAYLSGAIAVCRHTPAVWNELTQEEIDRLDLLMKCFAVSSAFVTDDDNFYKTGPALTGNYSKTWNPNHRFAMIEPMIYASLYFGGAEAVDEILLNFDHDTYIAEFDRYGYVNVKHNWTMEGFVANNGATAPGSKELMMNGGTAYYKFDNAKVGIKAGEAGGTGVGVRTAYTYSGYTLDEPGMIYEKLINYNYNGGAVFSAYYDNAGEKLCWILGDLTSPMEGEDGMMLEFNSSDGGGIRSSATYCLEDFVLSVSCGQVLKAFGKYDPRDNARLFRRTFVGNTDFMFKLDNGYQGYSMGSGYLTQASNNICYYGWRSLWLSEYGDLTLADLPMDSASKNYDFEMNLPELTKNGFNIVPGGESAEIETSDHAHGGYSVLRVRVQENWGRVRFAHYVGTDDVGKSFVLRFYYYVETELPAGGSYRFGVKIDTADCHSSGGYAVLSVPVESAGTWIPVEYSFTYTQEMFDAKATCLVFTFPDLGQVHAQRDDSYNYILDDGGNLIGVRFAEILFDDFTLEECAPELPACVFDLDFEGIETLPASGGNLGSYGKATQEFTLDGVPGENRYVTATVKDTSQDTAYQFYASNSKLIPAGYVTSVPNSSGKMTAVVDSMKYTFDFEIKSPDEDSMPGITFTIYNQNNGGGIKLISFGKMTAKTAHGGETLAVMNPGEFTRFTVTVDLTDTSAVVFVYYVNGEYVLTETLTPDVNASESEYAQACLGLDQYKFSLVKGTAVGKTFSVDNIRFYCDLVPPAEQ